MNQQEPPAVVVAEPVGHEGARVEIRQRPAAMVSGWLGVAVLLGCVAATIVAALILLHSFVDYPLRTGAMMAMLAFACALMLDPVAMTDERTSGDSTEQADDADHDERPAPGNRGDQSCH